VDPTVGAGTTRRTALRTLGGAAALATVSGPLALLNPPTAHAYTPHSLFECLELNVVRTRREFEACVEKPMREFEEAEEELAQVRSYLRQTKNPAIRAKQKKAIERIKKERGSAQKAMEFCNDSLISDLPEGSAKCHANYPPSAEEGGAPKPHGPGCEAGYLLCGEECCDVSNAVCEGCSSGPLCCRIGGECCPDG
jgi:hypothetical protein